MVIGAGAVGASIAAELHRAGVDTLLVARGAQLTALRDKGLTYVRPDGAHQLRLPVVAGPDEVELAENDVLVLATKSPDTAAAVRDWAWRPVKRADGRTGVAATDLPLVTLQNGLDNERTALRSFAHVIGGVVWIPATFVVPGEVVNHADPVPAVLFLGRYPAAPGTDPVAERVAGGLRQGGFTVHLVADVTAHKAAKLLGNLVNSLDALYPPSELRDAAVAALRAEATAVYAAAGIVPAVPDHTGFGVAEIATHPRVGNSTRQSLTRSTVPETDFLDGEIVLLGRLHGVPTPAAAAVQARIHRAITETTPAGSLDDTDLAATLPALKKRPLQPEQAADLSPLSPGLQSLTVRYGTATDDTTRDTVLVTAQEIYRRAAEPAPPVLLDVRWALGDPHGAEHYRAGHLPGAVYVDLDTELAGAHAPGAGRHPLPTAQKLQSAARRWGISRDSTVVVYDNSGGLAAARAWWLLRWAGVPDVRILDGGLAAWREAGYAEATGEARTRPAGDITLNGGHLPVLTADEAAALPATGTLLDARAGERYRGEVEPIDPRAGHIPGAVSKPTGENLRAGVPYFKSTGELRDRFADVRGPVGVYCGSGVTAAHQIAALAVAGIDAALYPGSWSAWSSDPSRPLATGAQP
nr:rhodanese-like domain-containing protein [Actinoplanes awajinensis]